MKEKIKAAKKAKKAAAKKAEAKKKAMLEKKMAKDPVGTMSNDLHTQMLALKAQLDNAKSSSMASLAAVMWECQQIADELKKKGVTPAPKGTGKKKGIVDKEGLGSDYAFTPWRKPVPQEAIDEGNQGRFQSGEAPVCSTTPGEMGEMGVGIELYFVLLKYLAIVFFLMTVIAVPALSLNKEGHMIPDEDVGNGLVLLTLGNIGLHPGNIAKLGGCLPDGTIDCNGTVIDASFARLATTASYVISAVDVMYSFCFLAFVVIFNWKIEQTVAANDDANITPGDYAVMVYGMPAYATELSVLEFFNQRYGLDKPHEPWRYPWLPWKPCYRVTSDVARGEAEAAHDRAQAEARVEFDRAKAQRVGEGGALTALQLHCNCTITPSDRTVTHYHTL
jgi:hypothetical protein